MSRTLVFGGARSGKEVIYLATARAGGEEMAARIAHHRERRPPRWQMVEEATALAATLPAPGEVVFVSDEVGMGIVPVGAVSRIFADEAGRLNQEVATRCDRVLFVAAGLPLALKGSPC